MDEFKLPTGKHKPRTKLSQSRFMVAGPPGIGKTVFGSQWPNALFLATEPGAHLMSVAEGEIRSWEAFNSAMDKLEYTKHPYRTVVIDTVDNLYFRCVEHVCRELGVKHVSDAPYKGWEMLKLTWTEGIHRAASMRNKDGDQICPLFIGHTKLVPARERVDGRMIETGVMVQGSNLPGTGRGILHSAIDFLFGVHMDKDGKRWLVTQPTELGGTLYDAKGRGTPEQMLPTMIPMTFTALNESFKEVFGGTNNGDSNE